MYINGSPLSLEHRIHSLASSTGDLFTGYLPEGNLYTGNLTSPIAGNFSFIYSSGDGSYTANSSVWTCKIYSYKTVNNINFFSPQCLSLSNTAVGAPITLSLNLSWTQVTGVDGYKVISSGSVSSSNTGVHYTLLNNFIDSGNKTFGALDGTGISPQWTGYTFKESKNLNREFLKRYSCITNTGQTGSYLGLYINPSGLYF